MNKPEYTVVCNECGGMWESKEEWEWKDPCFEDHE